MINAAKLMPPRIDLKEFDVLILLHWQERHRAYTGVTAATMCLPGQVKVIQWTKDRTAHELDLILEEIDCKQDLILFPGADSVDATQVNWLTNGRQSGLLQCAGARANIGIDKCEIIPRKKRLIVIESSWTNGKTVYNELKAGLNNKYPLEADQIRCISLSNIVGQYWRFQAVGHSAVSTIEAIYHTAIIAKKLSCTEIEREEQEQEQNKLCDRKIHELEKVVDDYDVLLLFFRMQRSRVLTEMKEVDGKLPRAMRVTGTGIGDWNAVLSDYDMHLHGQVGSI
jgi:hypothetical protein